MTPEALISEQRLGCVRILGLLLRGFPWYGWHSANFLLKVLQARLECSHRCGLTYVCSSRWVRTGPACADAGQRAVLYHSVRFSHLCSSFLLQQLKPVLCIVRSAMSSINSLTVVYEKHQILPDRHTNTCTWLKHGLGKQRPCLRGSYPVANPGDDGEQILHFPLQ